VLFVNGRPVADDEPHLSALDRGFTLGDGVFETMRAAGRRVFRWPEHLARLRAGAAVLGIPLDDLPLEAHIAAALAAAALPTAVVRLTVSRGVDRARGVAVPSGLRPTVVVRVLPLAPPPAQPARAIVAATTRRNERSPLSRIKSLSYGDAVLARMEAERRGADEALVCNTRGWLAGATTANLFAVIDGALLTPPVTAGALPGTTRAWVLAAAGALGMPVRERSLRPRDLARASEAFITNVVLGLRPLAAVDDLHLPDRAGPCARALQAAWEARWAAFVAGDATAAMATS
jgi:branched-chain amino acid aminotransferase